MEAHVKELVYKKKQIQEKKEAAQRLD